MKTLTYNPETHRLAPVEVEPVAWCIRFKSDKTPDGFIDTHYHGTNAIADYRMIDPCAVSQPLYSAPPDYEEIKRQRDELLEVLNNLTDVFANIGITSGLYDDEQDALKEACATLASVKGRCKTEGEG